MSYCFRCLTDVLQIKSEDGNHHAKMAIIEIPYQGNVEDSPEKAISMMIYQPLTDADPSFMAAVLNIAMHASLEVELDEAEIQIQFPKIKMQSEIQLKDVSN